MAAILTIVKYHFATGKIMAINNGQRDIVYVYKPMLDCIDNVVAGNNLSDKLERVIYCFLRYRQRTIQKQIDSDKKQIDTTIDNYDNDF